MMALQNISLASMTIFARESVTLLLKRKYHPQNWPFVPYRPGIENDYDSSEPVLRAARNVLINNSSSKGLRKKATAPDANARSRTPTSS